MPGAAAAAPSPPGPADHALAALTGSVVACVALYPLDQVRALQQSTFSPRRDGRQIRSMSVLRLEIRDGGVAATYAGLGGIVTSLGVSTVLYMLLYESCRGWIRARRRRPPNTAENLTVAFVCGAAQSLVTNPLWVVSTRLRLLKTQQRRAGRVSPKARRGSPKARAPSPPPPPPAFADMLRGVIARGEAWKGLGSSILLCLNPAIQYGVYELLRQRALEGRIAIDPRVAFVYGAVAKAVATVITYPLQVIQTQIREVGAEDGMWPVVRGVVKDDGLQGLFKGIAPKLAHSALNSALMFMIYESLLGVVMRARTRLARLAAR